MATSSYYPGGSASATEYTTYQELLSQLPDNSGNLIDAVNVRNSVYTLWQRVSQVQTFASQSASASSTYTNATPTPNTVGGIPAGSTFSNKTMTEMWDALLYPYISPSSSFLSGGGTREFGSPNNVSLSWLASKGSKNATGITVCVGRLDQESISLTTINSTGNQSGTKSTNSTSNVDTTFYMTVTDIPNGTSTVSAQTTVYWSNRRYWGTLASGHTLLTVSSLPFSHSDVSSLSSELSNSYAQTRSITTNFNYVVFVWPHNSVDLSTNPPHVSIGGFGNNNWIKTRNNVQFTNQFGYTGTNYDVWVFGNTIDGAQSQAPNTFTYVIS